MSETEPISSDLHCLVCGYNLRGLTPDRNCPECGLHVQRTLDLGDPDRAMKQQQARGEVLDARYDAVLGKWEEHARRTDQLLDAIEALVQRLDRRD